MKTQDTIILVTGTARNSGQPDIRLQASWQGDLLQIMNGRCAKPRRSANITAIKGRGFYCWVKEKFLVGVGTGVSYPAALWKYEVLDLRPSGQALNQVPIYCLVSISFSMFFSS